MQSTESQYIARAKPEIAKLLFDKSGRPKRIPLSSTQIEIALEYHFSYWIVLKALKQMVEEGTLNRIEKRTKYAGIPAFYYPRKLQADIDNLHKHINSAIALIERYSHPDITDILGKHLEALVKAELRAQGFTIVGTHTNRFNDRKWTKTAHNLDFIATHNTGELNIGVEVKNTFEVIPRDEIKTKIELCQVLGLKPVFATRWILPYVREIEDSSGLGWMFKTQMYPLGFEPFVKQVYQRLKLPVSVRTELPEKTIRVFSEWVGRQLARVS